MKSSIKVDFQDLGNGLEPVIKAVIIDSDDTRDKLFKTFFQSLGKKSSWLKVDFSKDRSDVTYALITPVKPEDLVGLSAEALDRAEKK